MKTILFPTDFSKVSLNAFSFALHLAKKIQAKIITLHVYEIPGPAFVDYHEYIMEIYEIEDWDKFDNFKGEVPKFRAIAEKEQLEQVEILHILKKGSVIETILEVSETENIDFIVMGTKGATGLKEVFVGTITQKTMNNSKVPIVAIPENYKYKPLKKILFLTEYKLSQLPPLKEVHNLALLFNAHIDVLQVSLENKDQDITFSNKWTNERPNSDVKFHLIHSNNSENSIFDFIALQNIDCVVVLIHHYSFFEKLFKNSVSKTLAYHLELPLLSVYDKEQEEEKL